MEKKSPPLKLDMRVTPEFLALIDDMRRAEADLPSRSEMVRRAIEAYAALIRDRAPKAAAA